MFPLTGHVDTHGWVGGDIGQTKIIFFLGQRRLLQLLIIIIKIMTIVIIIFSSGKTNVLKSVYW